jgi:hypothetical protein
MRTWLNRIPAVFASLAVSASWAQSGPEWVGTWSGTVSQPGLATYSIELSLRREDGQVVDGTVRYPELRCSGVLSPQAAPAGELRYRERISPPTPSCVSGGAMSLRQRRDGLLEWQWFWPDGRLGATAQLKRTAATPPAEAKAPGVVPPARVAEAAPAPPPPAPPVRTPSPAASQGLQAPRALASADDPAILALLADVAIANVGNRSPVEWLRFLASQDIDAAGLYVLMMWAPVRVLPDAPQMYGSAVEVANRESFDLPGLDTFVFRIEALARDYGSQPQLGRPFETLTARHESVMSLMHAALVLKQAEAAARLGRLLAYFNSTEYMRRWLVASTQQARMLVFLSHNAESLARAARSYTGRGEEMQARYMSLARVTVLQLMRLLSSSSPHETGLAVIAFDQQRRSWEGSIMMQSMLNGALQEIFSTRRCSVIEYDSPGFADLVYRVVQVNCPD